MFSANYSYLFKYSFRLLEDANIKTKPMSRDTTDCSTAACTKQTQREVCANKKMAECLELRRQQHFEKALCFDRNLAPGGSTMIPSPSVQVVSHLMSYEAHVVPQHVATIPWLCAPSCRGSHSINRMSL